MDPTADIQETVHQWEARQAGTRLRATQESQSRLDLLQHNRLLLLSSHPSCSNQTMRRLWTDGSVPDYTGLRCGSRRRIRHRQCVCLSCSNTTSSGAQVTFNSTGEPDRAPVRPGIPVTDLTAGFYAYGAILAAVISRQQTGQGVHIDVSMFDCQVGSFPFLVSSR